MAKQLTKETFGQSSPAVLTLIETSDKVQALRGATFRFEARLSELERQFEAKAAELREEYLRGADEINGAE